ncbi:MAG: hypothetical protein KKA07_01675, partial [Bacteroidetes bacterium]|nr:hypothetical protein [Bacteroidota bacterium]
LIDESKLVDSEPGIKLNVTIAGKDGHIWLSSIYGSYNFNVDIDAPKGEIASNYCPHCHYKLVGKLKCEECHAPMTTLNLEMGGSVDFCTRIGCKGHHVEFKDLSTALNKFYQDYGLRGKHHPDHEPKFKKRHEEEEKHLDEIKEVIESGTLLHTYCPHCRKSLIDDDMLKLKVQNGEEGFLLISPFMNVFSSKSTLFLPDGTIMKNVRCWHCDESLLEKDAHCTACGTEVIKIMISARTKMIDFYICATKGCRWHGLSQQDLHDIRLDDSLEW